MSEVQHYRYLAAGEVIQASDEVWITDKWEPTESVGLVVGEPGTTVYCDQPLPYRRAEEPSHPALAEALKGDEEPDLWFLSWTESVLRHVNQMIGVAVANEGNLGDLESAFEDCQSLNEATRYGLRMCANLRAALKAAGEDQ